MRTYRKTQLWVAIVGLVFLSWSLVRFAQTAVPFANYTIHGYVAMPEEGCPGTLVRVTVDRTLTKPLLGRVNSIFIRSYWEHALTGATPGSDTFTQPFTGNYGRRKVQSEFLRLVPDRSGQWRLVSEITVSGRVLGRNRVATVHAKSQNLFTVLPSDDPRCSSD
jgi:hypothetical protein